eukprot:CAMPEP_0198140362 /NCGR_PEP_ID=MMETSP1443-20131203/3531_1 /TAXON_ID=186043 /ORGANISM="Entomoneis sp., Strain CCMP2396" /LENGTH=357 /DNA_ID=CAMNT_0043802755 /DNA_START=182 /DNA_END=1255 /DNA_ORIENTATION=-
MIHCRFFFFWSCFCAFSSSNLFILTEGLVAVQVRTSTLLSWKKSPDSATGTTIGWAREERDIEQETYHVHIGIGEQQQTKSEDDDNDDDRNNGSSQSKKHEDPSVLVSLPFLRDETPLGATLWPAGVAMTILLHVCNNSDDSSSSASLREMLQKTTLELGAGVGLPGRFLAQQGASKVVSTDNDSQVLRDCDGENEKSQGLNWQSRCLEWRDEPDKDLGKFDLILGADVAYYYFLLRPLMDTIQSYLSRGESTCMIVCQANRKSQWDLYHNIVDGCYNQLTDQHDVPWEGKTNMLLYNLRVGSWQEGNDNVEGSSGGTVPIAALLHETNTATSEATTITPWDYVATKEDENKLDMSF